MTENTAWDSSGFPEFDWSKLDLEARKFLKGAGAVGLGAFIVGAAIFDLSVRDVLSIIGQFALAIPAVTMTPEERAVFLQRLEALQERDSGEQ